ncbi:MAG: transporter permease [Nocardioides sp.]|nr:transporter permease [Nocardioides sp.]
MSALSATLRIARRDARRAKGRSALVVAMIALPVMGVGASDVLYRTYQLSPEQKAVRTMGQADAILEDTGQKSIVQQCGGGCGFDAGDNARSGAAPAFASALPAGTRVLPETYGGSVSVSVGRSTTRADLSALDLDDPIARGLYADRTGRSARTADEVVLSHALARRLSTGIGGHVTVAGAARTVVGLVDAPDDLSGLTVLGAPAGTKGTSRVLVDAPRPLTWADVQRANRSGFFVTTRFKVPGEPAVPPSLSRLTGTAITAVSLVVGMTLLEIVLLAGPAFAVGAKRRTRDLALLSASGAEKRDIRRTVLGGGLVLGALGGVTGVLGGLVLARLAEPTLTGRTNALPGPTDLRPIELLGVVAVGIVTALLAAVLPARQAARQDVVAALTGRRGTLRSLKRTPVLGLLAAFAGTAIALAGASHRNVNVILAGSAMAELGLVATTPFIVGLVGRLGRVLPLGPRLALRDGARNRGRTAPAVSAILAAVAGSVAVGTYLASLDRYDANNYRPSAVYGSTIIRTVTAAEQSSRILAADLPDATVQVLRGVGFATSDAAPPALTVQVPDELSFASGKSFTAFGTPLVGDTGTVHAVTGLSGEALRRAGDVLAHGGAVVPAGSIKNGTVQLQVFKDGASVPLRSITLSAYSLPRDGGQDIVLSPAAATRLRVPVGVAGVIASAAKPPTAHQQDRIASALAQVDADAGVSIERGYSNHYGASLLALVVGSAVIVLGASGIATGLAAADGRADLATLAAVGASPVTRRTLAAFQSAVTAGLGTLLGAIAGLVPAIGMVRALNATARTSGYVATSPYPLVLPWHNLLITVLVVPLIAAGGAALLTRSRLPMVRRLA